MQDKEEEEKKVFFYIFQGKEKYSVKSVCYFSCRIRKWKRALYCHTSLYYHGASTHNWMVATLSSQQYFIIISKIQHRTALQRTTLHCRITPPTISKYHTQVTPLQKYCYNYFIFNFSIPLCWLLYNLDYWIISVKTVYIVTTPAASKIVPTPESP